MTTEDEGHSGMSVEPNQAEIKKEPASDVWQPAPSTTSDTEDDSGANEDPDWSEENETDETYDASPKRAKWG